MRYGLLPPVLTIITFLSLSQVACGGKSENINISVASPADSNSNVTSIPTPVPTVDPQAERDRLARQELKEYAERYVEKSMPRRFAGRGKAAGKAVMVAKDVDEGAGEKNVYYTFMECESIPVESCAQSVEELTTIVLREESEVTVGKYENGANACVTAVKISIVDVTTSTIIATKTFRGGEPPEVIYRSPGSSRSECGYPPDSELIDKYIAKVFPE